MNYGSVCSGVEAATLAWHSLGWNPVWFSEIEPFPCKVLKHHYPHVPNVGNMLHLNENKIYNESTINLLVGGTPCQSFSIAGLRKGLASENGNLALEFCRILIAKQPRWFVWENVPGAFSSFSNEAESKSMAGIGSENGRIITETSDFATILTAFRECGYSCAYRVLDAQYFGVPLRRRRIFVIGYLGNDWRPPASVLFDAYGLSGNTKKSGKKGQKVAALTKSGVGTCGADDNQAQGGHIIAIRTAQTGANGHGINTDGTTHTLDQAQGQAIVYDTNQITSKYNGSNPKPGDPCPTLGKRAEAPLIIPCWWDGGQTSQTLDRVLSKGQTMPEMNRFPAVLWSIMPMNSGKDYKAQQVEVTQPLIKSQRGLQSVQGGDIIQEGIRVRRLTPLECERLQGFPDNYTNIPGASDTSRYQAIGNSMAVPVMHWIGKRIDIVDKYLQSIK